MSSPPGQLPPVRSAAALRQAVLSSVASQLHQNDRQSQELRDKVSDILAAGPGLGRRTPVQGGDGGGGGSSSSATAAKKKMALTNLKMDPPSTFDDLREVPRAARDGGFLSNSKKQKSSASGGDFSPSASSSGKLGKFSSSDGRTSMTPSRLGGLDNNSSSKEDASQLQQQDSSSGLPRGTGGGEDDDEEQPEAISAVMSEAAAKKAAAAAKPVPYYLRRGNRSSYTTGSSSSSAADSSSANMRQREIVIALGTDKMDKRELDKVIEHEYAVRMCEQLGVSPSASNIARVHKKLPLSQCSVTQVMHPGLARGERRNCVSIVPRFVKQQEERKLADLRGETAEKWKRKDIDDNELMDLLRAEEVSREKRNAAATVAVHTQNMSSVGGGDGAGGGGSIGLTTTTTAFDDIKNRFVFPFNEPVHSSSRESVFNRTGSKSPTQRSASFGVGGVGGGAGGGGVGGGGSTTGKRSLSSYVPSPAGGATTVQQSLRQQQQQRQQAMNTGSRGATRRPTAMSSAAAAPQSSSGVQKQQQQQTASSQPSSTAASANAGPTTPGDVEYVENVGGGQERTDARLAMQDKLVKQHVQQQLRKKQQDQAASYYDGGPAPPTTTSSSTAATRLTKKEQRQREQVESDLQRLLQESDVVRLTQDQLNQLNTNQQQQQQQHPHHLYHRGHEEDGDGVGASTSSSSRQQQQHPSRPDSRAGAGAGGRAIDSSIGAVQGTRADEASRRRRAQEQQSSGINKAAAGGGGGQYDYAYGSGASTPQQQQQAQAAGAAATTDPAARYSAMKTPVVNPEFDPLPTVDASHVFQQYAVPPHVISECAGIPPVPARTDIDDIRRQFIRTVPLNEVFGPVLAPLLKTAIFTEATLKAQETVISFFTEIAFLGPIRRSEFLHDHGKWLSKHISSTSIDLLFSSMYEHCTKLLRDRANTASVSKVVTRSAVLFLLLRVTLRGYFVRRSSQLVTVSSANSIFSDMDAILCAAVDPGCLYARVPQLESMPQALRVLHAKRAHRAGAQHALNPKAVSSKLQFMLGDSRVLKRFRSIGAKSYEPVVVAQEQQQQQSSSPDHPHTTTTTTSGRHHRHHGGTATTRSAAAARMPMTTDQRNPAPSQSLGGDDDDNDDGGGGENLAASPEDYPDEPHGDGEYDDDYYCDEADPDGDDLLAHFLKKRAAEAAADDDDEGDPSLERDGSPTAGGAAPQTSQKHIKRGMALLKRILSPNVKAHLVDLMV